ncbi:hypothetical protein [Stenotrophomonas sp.]|uniref:hypothetical protein n=1 Tax=Stenotrophomonas sp. TaxID=69392 RepID=UPI002897CF99|nr:hypothetical protein [Stenotrophomonas sp.]
MRLSDSDRRELLKAMYSTERLAHLFECTTYYSAEPSRSFLDAIWKTIETGIPPQPSAISSLKKYLNSDKVPNEEECTGADSSGHNFILALYMILSFFKDKNLQSLQDIYREVEGSYINDLAIADLVKGSSNSVTVITEELSARANAHPIFTSFLNQLTVDHDKAHSIPLQQKSIEASKAGSVEDINDRGNIKR